MSETVNQDLLFQADIRAAVRAAYSAIPAGAGRPMVERFYDAAEQALLPASAIDWALGVGNPVRAAQLNRGERVVDLGCGGGIDSVLAAHAVGPTGHVVGVDTLPEMCERAAVATTDAGVAAWCEFRIGELESLPLPDGGIDVVISNGVLNLSPRKSRALLEAARVLRPGGRLCIVDLAVNDDLPAEVLSSPAAWAGCIAGAVSERVLRTKLANAGFEGIEVDRLESFGIDDVALYPLFTPEVLSLMRQLIPADAHHEVAVSVLVRAARP